MSAVQLLEHASQTRLPVGLPPLLTPCPSISRASLHRLSKRRTFYFHTASYCRVDGAGPLRVLTRDAPQGVSLQSSAIAQTQEADIIVLGISPEALVTATSLAASSTAPLVAPQIQEGVVGIVVEPPARPLLDAQELLAAASPLLATKSLVASSDVGSVRQGVVTAPAAATLPAQVYAGPAERSTTAGSLAIEAASAIPSSAAPADSTALPQEGHQQQGAEGALGQLWSRVSAAFRAVHWPKIWALTLLSVSYIHQATTGFALPAMLPMISNELSLTDLQGALLTTGYSYLYAVALVPIGLLADRVSRPKLLAAGLALWSVLTCTASTCRSFGDLMLARVGFAAAQGAQNPVCFSLIPELFPANKSTALALYNCAIYVGRALSFAAVLLARHLHDNDQAHLAARGGVRLETRLDHLDRADLHSLSIMHTAGDMAAATPDREFFFPLWEYGSELPDAAWRQVLRWIAVPGFAIGLAMMATLQEPRTAAAAAAAAAAAPPATELTAPAPAAAAKPALAAVKAAPSPAAAAPASAASAEAVAAQPASAAADADGGGGGNALWALLRSPGFMSVTLAAALNDVGSYALIAWQSTFYERVYGLESSVYAPVLATLLPIAGILGGVGGGFLADRLGRVGRRVWVTAGATCAAAPCLALSCLAPSPEMSYAALFLGFGLSEMWRAPSAVMARGIAPPLMGSTASALYLCVRNLVGGMGPLAVALLIGRCGLQSAMLVVPAMYAASGVLFAQAEKLYDAEMRAKEQVKSKTA